MTFSLLPIGTGDAFSAKHYSFCLLLEADGARLLVDCPHPIRKMLVEAGARAKTPLDVTDVDGVVLTHLHADHCSGLETLGYFFRFALGKRLPLLAHPSVLERLWEGALAAGMEQLKNVSASGPELEPEFQTRHLQMADYFDVTELSFDQPTTFGPFSIETRETTHHIPTTALRVAAAGRTLGISADTRFDDALLRWLLQADLAVHEVGFGDMHTAPDALTALDGDDKRRLRLVHYPDELELAPIGIEPLREGQRVEVANAPRA